MWIHQHRDWPNFVCDADRLTSRLADVRHRQGRLQGRMEGLGFSLRHEANLRSLTSEVVKSSAIEGERLDVDEVRSSIARRLGIQTAGMVPVSRDVEGIVEMMLDATRRFSEPLTKDRLCDWHAAMFPAGRSGIRRITVGAWRNTESGPMQIVSGPVGRETVHFEAPGAERLETEMTGFLAWFENADEIDPVLKAGIAHLWFLTIHPFEDGNGRIGRAIADMALARADGMADRYYSLSTQIESERKDYYDQLEKQQRGTPDITDWLQWFVDCLGRAIASAAQSLSRVLYKARLWEQVNEDPVNERQRCVINRMLEDDFVGFMNTSKYASLAKCSADTALRDIQNLKAREVFIQNPGGGRSTSYRLPDEISE
ncbi:MAG: Fic family protein [Gammaproteobacteria bacterium]|nr:Fic family protein [Gammaproteobacteria bacterium]MDE0508919.1 Fic family protein [Gammaproteobacteria bacterium]MXY91079.1 Fic family protein [Gammaproteobacteria bacterium]MYA67505.1 Fic family protein [Gammaproteobacteria bacterium]MYG95916.1 Fic family protein [Gammaproteobacteria bacterium]